MSVQFSELCNTDRATYFAYIAGVLSSYGSSFEQVGLVRWDLGHEGLGGSGGGFGESFGVALAIGNGEGAQGLSDGGVRAIVGGSGGAVDSGDEVVDEKCCAFGDAIGDVSGDGSGDVGGNGDEFVGGCAEDSVGIRYAKILKPRAFEAVGGCLLGGVQGVTVGGAAAVAGPGGSEREKVVVDMSSCGQVSGSPASSVVKGGKKPKRGKNQRDREKYRQEIGAASWRKADVVEVEKSELRVSLEKKWAAQNELAAEKARKDLEYQKARDVDAEARKSRARLMKETESSKVATEKAFAFLKSTGNVAGFCETVVSDGSSPGLTDGSSPGGSVPGCTISPDSSASMHEFREAQKKIADLEFQNRKLLRQLEIGKLNAGEEATFTVHSDGEVSDDVKEAIAKNKTDFFDVDTNDDGYEGERPHTLYAKRVSIPGADEYLYDNY